MTQVHVGVLNGKYDLAGSEFKIWPSNYYLEEDNLEKKIKNLTRLRLAKFLIFFPNYPPPDHNLRAKF